MGIIGLGYVGLPLVIDTRNVIGKKWINNKKVVKA